MICEKCGALLSEEDDFCSECGTAIRKSSHSLKRMQLKCKVCSGEMQLNDEQTMLVCPFCGSKELLVESDEVTIAEMQKEVELKRLENEAQRIENEAKRIEYEAQRLKDQEKKTKVGIGSKIFCVILFISTMYSSIISIVMFSELSIGAAVVSLIQTVLLLIAAIKALDHIRGKKNNLHIVLAVIGYSLIIVLPIVDSNEDMKLYTKYEWPSEGLATYLPQPESEYGEIWFDSERMFDIDVNKTTSSDFNEYVKLCQEAGFTVDVESNDYLYEAYNTEGYFVDVFYYETDEEINITISKPKEFHKINWPSSGIGSKLPVPESLMGSELQEYEESFSVYVGETSIEQYNAYVDECISKGFDNDYSRYEKEFRGANDDGDELTVNYEGFNIMYVYIKEER